MPLWSKLSVALLSPACLFMTCNLLHTMGLFRGEAWNTFVVFWSKYKAVYDVSYFALLRQQTIYLVVKLYKMSQTLICLQKEKKHKHIK